MVVDDAVVIRGSDLALASARETGYTSLASTRALKPQASQPAFETAFNPRGHNRTFAQTGC
jgi:hypothetical protein